MSVVGRGTAAWPPLVGLPSTPPVALEAAWPLSLIKGRRGPGSGRRSHQDGGRGKTTAACLLGSSLSLCTLRLQLGPRRLGHEGPSGRPAAWEGSSDPLHFFRPQAQALLCGFRVALSRPREQRRGAGPPSLGRGYRVSAGASECPSHRVLPRRLFSSLAEVRPWMALLF